MEYEQNFWKKIGGGLIRGKRLLGIIRYINSSGSEESESDGSGSGESGNGNTVKYPSIKQASNEKSPVKN